MEGLPDPAAKAPPDGAIAKAAAIAIRGSGPHRFGGGLRASPPGDIPGLGTNGIRPADLDVVWSPGRHPLVGEARVGEPPQRALARAAGIKGEVAETGAGAPRPQGGGRAAAPAVVARRRRRMRLDPAAETRAFGRPGTAGRISAVSGP